MSVKSQISLIFGLFLISSIASASAPAVVTSSSLKDYYKYLNDYSKTLGPLGNSKNGEIEIIKDPLKIDEIEKSTGRKVGIMAEDKYWLWLNDAVQFPNQKSGVYGRLLWKSSLKGRAGVAVMAVLPNGKIVLNRNFRHATRSWEYELPRGAVNSEETIESAATREVKEETGMVIKDLKLLGEMAVDSGTLNTIVPIFLANVSAQEKALPEDSEAIAEIEAFSISELKQGFKKGYIEKVIKGKKESIPLRDPFLAYALLLNEIEK